MKIYVTCLSLIRDYSVCDYSHCQDEKFSIDFNVKKTFATAPASNRDGAVGSATEKTQNDSETKDR